MKFSILLYDPGHCAGIFFCYCNYFAGYSIFVAVINYLCACLIKNNALQTGYQQKTNMKNLVSIAAIAVFAVSTFSFSGCARGEDDPFLTFHSRDARLTQEWKLVSFTGTSVETIDGAETNIEYTYDGTNLYTTINGITTSATYEFTMEVKANGEVFSVESMNDIDTGDPLSQSSKTSFWYWGDDDKNKTAVYLDLTGVFSGVLVYDIPRLAYNDMTLAVSYSDNYTFGDSASSLNLNYELMFEVILP